MSDAPGGRTGEDDTVDANVDVGILSTAHLHADAYAPLLDGMDGANFLGVADPDGERGRAFADEHGVEHCTPDDLLAAAAGVVVCSTNADHRALVERAAGAGVDVLCEKPLAPRRDDAEAAVEACEAAGVELGVAMPLRFSVPACEAKEALGAGDIGTLRSVAGTNRGRMPGSWFVDESASGGGAVMDHTVHVVDLVHWLTGERVAEVYAETASRIHDVPVEDVNLLSMELADGTGFSLDGSWSRPDDWRFWGDATVDLFGEGGVLSVDCFDQTFAHTGGDGVQSVFWGSDPNEGMLRDFVDAVGEGRAPETTGREGVAAVAVVEAAYESADRGEPVAVEY